MSFSYDFNIFVVCSGICVGWVLLNIRAISVIVTMPRSRSRPSTWLTAHMAVLAILANYSAFVYMANKVDSFSINRYLGICQFYAFVTDMTLALVPLNMMALNYERVVKCRGMNDTGKQMIRRIVFAEWAIAGACGIPSAFTVHHYVEFGKDLCKQEAIFGLHVFNIVIEMMRLVLLDFFVIGYILQTMQKVRKKHHYLYIIRPFHDILDREKLNKVRASFIQAAVFIAIWFPFGFLIFVHRLIHLYNIPCGYIEPFLRVGIFTSVLYVSFYPVIQNMMNGNLNYITWYKFCWKPRENDTLLTRLSHEMQRDTGLGERRFYRRQLRQDHLELSEEETVMDVGTPGSDDIRPSMSSQMSGQVPEAKWNEEEDDDSIYTPVHLTLITADVERSTVFWQKQFNKEGGLGSRYEKNSKKLLEPAGVSSGEQITTTPEDDASSANNYYSLSSTPTMGLMERVDSFHDTDVEHLDCNGGDPGNLCTVMSLDLENMLKCGHSETMV